MALAADLIGVHARLTPGKLAAHDLTSGQCWSYAQLDNLIARLAAALLARGCQPGDRVAVFARNSVFQVALHFACGRAGLIYVPLNWRLGKEELGALIALAEPRLLFTDEHGREALAANEPLGALFEESLAIAPLVEGARGQDRPSLLLFTSGTSGRPKGVIVTERNLRETAINFSLLTQVDRNSVFLCDAPMFHVIGLVSNIRPAMLQGGTILVSDGFEPGRTLARLADPALSVTHYMGVPQMMEALRREPGFDPEPLRRLTALVSGGAPHAPDDVRVWLADGVGLVPGFGMSEAGTVFGMSARSAAISGKIGTVGIAAPSVETRLVDVEGRDVPVGTPGELLLRGDSISPGYWRYPEETARSRNTEGWFATGDVARCDEDGFFWIVDRRKDMFISGGENVYPAEIEAHLASYPGIAHCAVVGVPDPRWGEVGHLAVVPKVGETVAEAELLAFLEQRLARYKRPKYVTMLAELPRTATGKVQKSVLRQLLQTRSL